MKAQPGRDRKRGAWIDTLYEDLREGFDSLRKLGVKFNLKILRHLALEILHSKETEYYSYKMIDSRYEQPLHKKIQPPVYSIIF